MSWRYGGIEESREVYHVLWYVHLILEHVSQDHVRQSLAVVLSAYYIRTTRSQAHMRVCSLKCFWSMQLICRS
jgi:hypothetical protein